MKLFGYLDDIINWVISTIYTIINSFPKPWNYVVAVAIMVFIIFVIVQIFRGARDRGIGGGNL